MKENDSRILPFGFGEGEKVLWESPAPRKAHVVNWSLMLFLLLGAVVLWILAFCLDFGPKSRGTEFGLFLGAVGCSLIVLFGVPCLLSHDRLQRRTYYVLTDRMAYIAYRPARKRGVWRIAGFAIHPGMVVRVKRYRNGSVDYILGMEKINKARRWRGFMNIQPENDPGPLLEQLGVVLPGKERSGKNPILFEWPSTPLSNMVWGWLVLIIGSVLLYVTLITERNMLFVTGQETDATVVNFKEKTEQRRGRYTTRTVLVYYPVVVYQTLEGDGWIAETSPGNTREPEYELGEKVKLLYDPHDPSRCVIKDYGVCVTPALFLLVTGFGLWLTIVSTRTWYRRRNTLAVVLCMNSSTGEICEVVLGHPVPDVSVPAQPELP